MDQASISGKLVVKWEYTLDGTLDAHAHFSVNNPKLPARFGAERKPANPEETHADTR